MKYKISLISCFLFIFQLINSQEYKFEHLGRNQGLSNSFIYSINQDKNGLLIVGTSEGVAVYDGKVFQMFNSDNGLAEDFVTTSLYDSKGNVWFGHQKGGASIYSNKEFNIVHSGDGINSVVKSIAEDKKGKIWFATQNKGIYNVDEKGKFEFYIDDFSDVLIQSICFYYDHQISFREYAKYKGAKTKKGFDKARETFNRADSDNDDFLSYDEFKSFISDNNINEIDVKKEFNITDSDGRMFIGSDNGLEVYDLDDEMNLYKVQEIQAISNLSVVDIIEGKNGDLIIATKHAGIYSLNKYKGVYKCNKIDIKNFNLNIMIKDIYLKGDVLFVSSIKQGVLKISIGEEKKIIEKYNKFSGLKTNAVNTSFVDREGVLWVGTIGEGIASKANNYFTFFFRDNNTPKKYTFLAVNDIHLYTASNEGILKYSKHDFHVLNSWGVDNGLPDDPISCFIFNPDSTLFVGTQEKGLYYKVHGEDQFKRIKLSGDLLSNSIRSICSSNGKLWVGTLNGVFKIDEESFGITSYSISTGLSHNSVGYVYENNKYVYVGTKSAFLTEFKDGEIKNYQLSNELNLVNINMIRADIYNNIWLSSKDNGLFVITGGDSLEELDLSYIIQYNVSDGLLSNYCYGVSMDNKNNIWVTHDGGISKFDKEHNEFRYYNEDDGLNVSFSESAIASWDNELWFGTDNGIIRYNAFEEFINEIPPITSIKSIMINDKVKKIDRKITLPYGEYEFEIQFNGLSLRKSDEVTYEFNLKGYDNKWSKRSDQHIAKYPKLSDGEYIFQVKSFNSDGIEGNTLEFKIIIEIPFWKRWWFYLIIFLFVILLVTLVIKLRERNLLKYQKTLENQLALRTKEVVSQKEEIEEINKDMTDSINYAKRIQLQLLPEDHYFKSIFPSSFVLYKPKDIVSGDFYWIRELGDEIILVCADCTGHGVPGGFMSMIGSILIHEAIVFHKKNDPSDIIYEIDLNIKTVLHQKDDYESNKDGMDLGIINLNKKTGKLKFSGAIRPCHIYRKGDINILSGDRYSIGGYVVKNKDFTTKEFQLKKGDYVYMFSDGFADQFGGKDIKKLKMSGFNGLLDKLSKTPMDSQHEIANNFLENWKGENAQMDDILLIGLEYI